MEINNNRRGWKRLGIALSVIWLLLYGSVTGYSFYKLLSKVTLVAKVDDYSTVEIVFSRKHYEEVMGWNVSRNQNEKTGDEVLRDVESSLIQEIKGISPQYRLRKYFVTEIYDKYTSQNWGKLALRHSLFLFGPVFVILLFFLGNWVADGFRPDNKSNLKINIDPSDKLMGTELIGKSEEPLSNYVHNDYNFLSRLIDGNYGLFKTYWCFVVIPSLLFSLIANFIDNIGALVVISFIGSFYFVCAYIGTIKSALAYKGRIIWKWLALITTGIGLLWRIPLELYTVFSVLAHS